jgi:5-enolpyruvylshikimate-3-phosphate synthase
VENWRVKETERMVAIVAECRKLGAEVEEGQDYCIITPPKVSKVVCLDIERTSLKGLVHSPSWPNGVIIIIIIVKH